MIRNVHERELPVAPGVAGRLLDSLSSVDDRLWPKDRWPGMRLDRPLKVGARGGHGPVRYTVSDLDPGRRVTFRFADAYGLDGHHWAEVFTRDGRTVLRHVLEGRPRGSMIVIWPLAFRWLHDALVEDALDGAAGAPRRRLGLWVRFLRRVVRKPRPAGPGPSGSAATRPG